MAKTMVWTAALLSLAGGGCSTRGQCHELYERIVECDPQAVIDKSGFVESCASGDQQTQSAVACMKEESCEAFHNCVYADAWHR
jgi:hypothetical protein